ncbi:MAG: CpaF family protein [Lachnospiraceae bacterium]|nr:CpaF family protein [Lachnospiraceae bacterium]
MDAYVERKKKLRQQIVEQLSFLQEQSDQMVRELIDEMICREEGLLLQPLKVRRQLREELFHSIRGLDVLQALLDDNSITEIMINGPDAIFVEREGRLFKLDMAFESREKLIDIIQQIVAGCNRTVNEANPIVDARLSGGARVNIVMNPVAIEGPVVTIRRFPDKKITMEELIERESISPSLAAFLECLVRGKYNIFISGGTGAGKTTFLNVLSGFIPEEERIVTIEDSAELQLQGLPNLVRLETRNSNGDGCREIRIRDLIRTSLRMRPDRIIVGEVRGEEAADMITCMNCGMEGSMCTGHANSAADMLDRLENMILMAREVPVSSIRRQVASGLDILVHLGRLRDKSRKVLEVLEVLGSEEDRILLRPLYRFRERGEKDGKIRGEYVKEGELMHVEKLQRAGITLPE